MSPVKAIASIVGLGLAATAVGVGTHSLSSAGGSTVEEKLESKRDRFLNFDYENDEIPDEDEKAGGGAGSYSMWLANVYAYRDEENKSERFEGLELEGEHKDQNDIKKLKKRCKRLLSSEGNQKNINLFESWCTKPKGLY